MAKSSSSKTKKTKTAPVETVEIPTTPMLVEDIELEQSDLTFRLTLLLVSVILWVASATLWVYDHKLLSIYVSLWVPSVVSLGCLLRR